jgi:hypothetical protein
MILIAIPTSSGKIPAQLVRDLFYLKKPVACGFAYIERSLVDHARNLLVRDALVNGFEHIFFVDDDMSLEPDTLTKLYEANKDIIGGLCVSRHTQEPCAFEAKEFENGKVKLYKPIKKIQEDVQEVDAIGTGCVLIKRQVLEKMFEKHKQFMFEFLKETNPLTGVVNYKGEDVVFCERAKELGFKVWLHSDVRPGHEAKTSYLTFGA